MKLGIIGLGNMGSAIIKGGIANGYLKAEEIYAYDLDESKMDAIKGIHKTNSEKELVESIDLLLVAIKPYHVEGFVERNKEALANKGIISIALGWNFVKYNDILLPSTRHQYIMPNTPCLVGEGMAIIEADGTLYQEEYDFAKGLFDSLGTAVVLPAHLIGVAGTVSGCGPAFMFVILEALGDAGVKYGVPRNQAYQIAAQMMLGSAKLMLETAQHPGVLKDQVCSPAGSTIRGVSSMEDDGVRAAMIHAVEKAFKMED